MKGFRAAIWAEGLKVRRSKMAWSTVLVFMFIAAMMGFLMLVARKPEIASTSEILGTKASAIGRADWPNYSNLLLQMVLTVGYLGFGIATSWMFGREFADRVARDMLALPVSRTVIIMAKFAVLGLWCLILSAVLFLTAVVAGWAVVLKDWSISAFGTFVRTYAGTSLLTLLLCPPIALIASAGRGYLPAIAFAILTLIITQFMCIALPGLTPFVPWAVPALFSHVGGPGLPAPGITGFITLSSTGILALAGTAAWWNRADQK